MKSSGEHKNRFRTAMHLIVGLCIFISAQDRLSACCSTPYPPFLLNDAGAAISNMPGGVFEQELKHLGFVSKWNFKAVPCERRDYWRTSTNYEDQTYDVAVDDFKKSLEASGMSAEKRESLLKKYEFLREIMKKHQRRLNFSALDVEINRIHGTYEDVKTDNTLKLSVDMVSGEFPAEFRDYLKGSVCWLVGGKNILDARRYWRAVLALPSEQRKYRTTWAAYMLARSYEDSEPAEAVKLYRKVRTLASQGFSDSLGLAVASMGREARIFLQEKYYDKALHLYLSQYLAGDKEAVNSIRSVLSEIIFKVDSYDASPLPVKTWAGLLKDPVILRMSIAYVTGYTCRNYYSRYTRLPGESMLQQFMDALTEAGYVTQDANTGELHPAQKIPSADRLAWIAYRAGKFDLARDFLAMADDTPMTHWVQAKLYLRDGETQKALQEYRYLTQPQRMINMGTLCTGVTDINNWEWDYVEAPAAWRIAGEYGCLLVSREQYVDALDVFIRNGWWDDAAYVADRILTPDELLDYVKKNFPKDSKDSDKDDGLLYKHYAKKNMWWDSDNSGSIRSLLARRLMRIGRWKEANEFYTSDGRKVQKELVDLLYAGRDISRERQQRADDLMKAARIYRNEGMWLIGTEFSPDYRIVSGAYGDSSQQSPQEIAQNLRKGAGAYKASPDEAARYIKSAARPNKRYHYRYVAADVAWDAAQLLPDNNQQTAEILYEAGLWLRYLDPQAADRFYKALVKRCGNTPLGRQANLKHWFPDPPVEQSSP